MATLNELTEDAALKFAQERADRQGEPMDVWVDGGTYYVRSAAEGQPDGADLLTTIHPEG